MQYYKYVSLSFEVIRNGRLPIGTLISTIPGINIRSLPLPPGVIKKIILVTTSLLTLAVSDL